MKTSELEERLDAAFKTIRLAVDHFGVSMSLKVGPLDNGQIIVIEFPKAGEELN